MISRIHTKIKMLIMTLVLALATFGLPVSVGVAAALECAANDATCATSSCSATNQPTGCIDCTKTKSCTDTAASSKTCQNDPGHTNCDIVADYVNPAIKLLNILVGVGAVLSLGYAGIMYSMAGGDPEKGGGSPQKVARAKSRIRWTIISLICYAFFYGFIEFLIPGGAFSRTP